jgi:hypothetical protein
MGVDSDQVRIADERQRRSTMHLLISPSGLAGLSPLGQASTPPT